METINMRMGMQIFKVQPELSTLQCDNQEINLCTRRGTLKCVKATVKENIPPWRKRKVRNNFHKLPTKYIQPCILHRKENIICKDTFQHITLPIKLKPGMKMTVVGGYISNDDEVDVSFNSNTKTNCHVHIQWGRKQLITIAGNYIRNTNVTIKNPSCFSLMMELTKTDTKIYLDGVFVDSVDLITGLEDFDVVRYRKIHLLVVQRTGNGCKQVNDKWLSPLISHPTVVGNLVKDRRKKGERRRHAQRVRGEED